MAEVIIDMVMKYGMVWYDEVWRVQSLSLLLRQGAAVLCFLKPSALRQEQLQKNWAAGKTLQGILQFIPADSCNASWRNPQQELGELAL